MRLAVILGAGFSKAAAGLPLTDQLGNELRRRLPRLLTKAVRPFADGSFETWLSRIAEPQPDLDDVANADNAALFAAATQTLQEILVESEIKAMRLEIAPWFHQFIRTLHSLQAAVITFNYDTIVERAVFATGCWDHVTQQPVNVESLFNGLPADLHQPGRYGIPEVPTLRLMKLHGSLDTYWVRGDASGATIGRLPGARRWVPSPANDRHERLAPGREPFIVPPASAKSGFYNNPISRQLWRNAADALSKADMVAVVGYSLPTTDLVTGGMIGDALGGRDVPIHVVNPHPEDVKDRLVRLGLGASGMALHGGSDCVAGFSNYLAAHAARRELVTLSAHDSHKAAVIVDRPGRAWPIVDVQRIPTGLGLIVRESTQVEIPHTSPEDAPATMNMGQLRAALTDDDAFGGLYVLFDILEEPVPIVQSDSSAALWTVFTCGRPLEP